MIEVENIFVPDEYINQESHRDNKLHKCDYGVLKLKQPIGNETGYFGLSVLPKDAINKIEELHIFGYPGDKFNEFNGGFSLWGDSSGFRKGNNGSFVFSLSFCKSLYCEPKLTFESKAPTMLYSNFCCKV